MMSKKEKRVQELLEIIIEELKHDPCFGSEEFVFTLEQFTDYKVVNTYFKNLNKPNKEDTFEFCFCEK